MAANILNFTGVSSLTDFQINKTFRLRYHFTEYSDISNIEIFRYIGLRDSTYTPTIADAIKIHIISSEAAEAQASLTGPENEYTYVDDLSIYNVETSNNLLAVHQLTDAIHDKEIVHDIVFTKRRVHYFIRIAQEILITAELSIPKVFGRSTHIMHGTKRLEATAPRTMVLNDVFYQEGDLMWSTLPNEEASAWTVQHGSYNFCIFSERNGSVDGQSWGEPLRGGKVFADSLLYDLRTGIQMPVWNRTGNLYNIRNGAPYVFHGDPLTVFGHEPQSFDENFQSPISTVQKFNMLSYEIPNNAIEYYNSTTFPEEIVDATWVKSITNSFEYDKYYCIVSFNDLQICKLYSRSKIFPNSPNNENTDLPITSQSIRAASDGSLWYFSELNRPTACVSRIPLYGHSAVTTGSLSDTTNVLTSYGYGLDSYYNPSIFRGVQDYNLIIGLELENFGGATRIHPFNTITKLLSTKYIDIDHSLSFNPVNVYGSSGTDDVYKFRSSNGIDVDSEGSVWQEHYNGYSSKLYQCDATDEYPLGGYCRYPDSTMSEWDNTVDNTKEIEWFYTRNGHKDVLHSYSPIRNKNDNTLEEIGGTLGLSNDPRYQVGLDDTIAGYMHIQSLLKDGVIDPQRLYSRFNGTAQELFNAIVNSTTVMPQLDSIVYLPSYLGMYPWQTVSTQNQFTADLIQGLGVGNHRCSAMFVEDETTYGDVSEGIQLKYNKYDNVVTSDFTRSFGKFLYEPKHEDQPNLQNMETSYIKQLITIWSEQFVDDATAYRKLDLDFVPGITSEAHRQSLIAKNKKGCRVYPNFNLRSEDNLNDRLIVMSRRSNALGSGEDFAHDCRKQPDSHTVNEWIVETFDSDQQPTTTLPSFNLSITPSYDPVVHENLNIYPWGDINVDRLGDDDSSSYSVTGYDNMTASVQLNVSPGSFIMDTVTFSVCNDVIDFDGNANELSHTDQLNNVTNLDGNYQTSLQYIYNFNDPSHNMHGELDDRLDTTFSINISALFSRSAYTYITPKISNIFNIIQVRERWPTAKFYAELDTNETTRYNWFGCPISWKPADVFYRNSGDEFEYRDSIDIDYTAKGVDPIEVQLIDRTFSRSTPISSWMLSISTTNIYSEEIINTWDPLPINEETIWKYATSFNVEDLGYTPQLLADSYNSIQHGTSAILLDRLFRYGDYRIELDIISEYFDTHSRDSDGELQKWIHNISIAPLQPVANFWPVSAMTVDPVNINNPMIPAHLPDGFNNFVSGNAPNLTVWFANSSESHTLPIDRYVWDFGDGTNATSYPSNTAGTFDSGCWSSSSFTGEYESMTEYPGALTVKHIYDTPGAYKVNLTAFQSDTNTSSVCALGDDSFYIYVSELPAQPHFLGSINLTTWALDAVTIPHNSTIYANASGTQTASFSLWKIVYDWGDGSPIETYAKYPYSLKTDLGTIVYPASSLGVWVDTLSADPFDPVQMIIPHKYYNTTDELVTRTVTMTGYVESSNRAHVAVETWDISVEPEIFATVDETRHLVKSRFLNNSNDVIYVLDGEEQNMTYHVVLSGDNNV